MLGLKQELIQDEPAVFISLCQKGAKHAHTQSDRESQRATTERIQ